VISFYQKEVVIHVAVTPVDMRKAIDGLIVLVIESLEKEPQSGDCFVFRNKLANKMKILYWDRNGFILHYKRLEKGRFKLPSRMTDDTLLISTEQLEWLLAGLDFTLMTQFPEMNFQNYF